MSCFFVLLTTSAAGNRFKDKKKLCERLRVSTRRVAKAVDIEKQEWKLSLFSPSSVRYISRTSMETYSRGIRYFNGPHFHSAYAETEFIHNLYSQFSFHLDS